MVAQLHAKDQVKINGEDKLIETICDLNIADGNDVFPGANSNQDRNDPEYQQKYKAGPRGIMTVLTEANMGVT